MRPTLNRNPKLNPIKLTGVYLVFLAAFGSTLAFLGVWSYAFIVANRSN